EIGGVAGEGAVGHVQSARAEVVDGAAAGGEVAGEGAVDDAQGARVEDGAAEEAGAEAGPPSIDDGHAFDREHHAGVHREHANRPTTADDNQVPTVNGGVGTDRLRAGDGNRPG